MRRIAEYVCIALSLAVIFYQLAHFDQIVTVYR